MTKGRVSDHVFRLIFETAKIESSGWTIGFLPSQPVLDKRFVEIASQGRTPEKDIPCSKRFLTNLAITGNPK